MEKLDTQLAELVAKLQEVGLTNAPALIDGAVQTVFINEIVWLVLWGVMFILAAMTFFGFLFYSIHHSSSMDSETLSVVLCGSGILGAVSLAAVAGTEFPAVINPEAYVNAEILHSILN